MTIHYDPMLGQADRLGPATATQALGRLERALGELRIEGIRTTVPLFQALLEDEDFRARRISTSSMLDRKLAAGELRPERPADLADLGGAGGGHRARRGHRPRRRRGAAGAARPLAAGGAPRGPAVKLIVEHRGRAEEVEVERRDGRWLVRVGETDYEVDLVTVAGSARSLRVDGGQYEVDVAHLGDGRYEVSRSGWVEELRVQDPLAYLASRAHGAVADHASQTVTAYMPGRVAAILVEPGARVAAGDGVLVLEAMKMENEIQAERDGVVGRILVALGDAVEGGDPLFELD